MSLVDSEIIVGIDFTQNKRLNQLLSDSAYFPVVLYPDDEAFTAQSPQLKEVLEPVAGGEKRKLLVIVVDATWFFAKKMLRLSPNVRNLAKLSFQQLYASEFTFKRQPAEGWVSTIESCYHLIREMQAAAVISAQINPEPLMSVFRRMVDFQLEAEQNRIALGIPGRHSYDGERDANRKKRKRRQRVESLKS